MADRLLSMQRMLYYGSESIKCWPALHQAEVSKDLPAAATALICANLVGLCSLLIKKRVKFFLVPFCFGGVAGVG